MLVHCVVCDFRSVVLVLMWKTRSGRVVRASTIMMLRCYSSVSHRINFKQGAVRVCVCVYIYIYIYIIIYILGRGGEIVGVQCMPSYVGRSEGMLPQKNFEK